MDTRSMTGEALAEPCMDPPPAIGNNERRMHVRAYNYWASLLRGRIFPSIDDLDPATIGDLGPHGVLLDFTNNRQDPAIPWLGQALRDEGGHSRPVATMADVPGRSLLSRLTDHFHDVVANRAPIGFEAEFVNVRGHHTLYRGILMPFSSNGESIDYIYGVVNWKEVADAGLVAGIAAEVARASTPPPRPTSAVPAWADGPTRQAAPAVSTPANRSEDTTDRLMAAREAVDLARSTEARARTALHRALGLAYDALLASEAATAFDPADRRASRRIAALVRDVFGSDEPPHRRADYAAVLAYGCRTGTEAGGLRMLIERQADGLNGVVMAERSARRGG
ncbi:MAG TPA: hypothetical protein VF649_09905 [Sphingomonas sp.]|jgi:hypothetical protein|uniref:hypothetical protein n=1 Tax=Sphingomonas sp. TaxID=28214 RepID=UPI002ED9A617